jgi:broad-specificity NMP kinase
MNPIFLVLGAPAVGKSSTSRALAAHFPKSIHIPVDSIRDMVVSGLALPGTEKNEALVEQVALARMSVCQMAFNYHEAGFVVVTDDFFHADHLRDYMPLIKYPLTNKILLYPDQKIAHERNLVRSGISPARNYIDEGIRIIYDQLQKEVPNLTENGWVIVDTTSKSIEETVSTIIQKTMTM